MNQKIQKKRDFKFGGNAIFKNPSENLPALITVKNSRVTTVQIAPKVGQKSYLHSECKAYNLASRQDVITLMAQGVIGFQYQTPTQLNLQ